jgi:hypothetical protein
MGEVMFLHPVLNKTLSRIFKIHSPFPVISLESGLVKLAKKMIFFNLGKAVLEKGKWFSDPLGVVSGIRGGSSSLDGGICPVIPDI